MHQGESEPVGRQVRERLVAGGREMHPVWMVHPRTLQEHFSRLVDEEHILGSRLVDDTIHIRDASLQASLHPPRQLPGLGVVRQGEHHSPARASSNTSERVAQPFSENLETEIPLQQIIAADTQQRNIGSLADGMIQLMVDDIVDPCSRACPDGMLGRSEPVGQAPRPRRNVVPRSEITDTTGNAVS